MKLIFVLTLALSTLPLSWAQKDKPFFTAGKVATSDGASFHQHTTPQIVKLGNGHLAAVMGVRSKTGTPLMRIGMITSVDGGKTWAKARILHEETEKDRLVADPNLLVDGNRVFAFWTRAIRPNEIKRTWTWGIVSEDNGITWSQPQEIHIPRQYAVGKQHNAIKLSTGLYAMGISWDTWPERGLNARTEGEMNLVSSLLLSRDGFNWNLFGHNHVFLEKPLPQSTNGLAEPSLVELASGEILMIMRSGGTRHYESRSHDGGITWSAPQPSPLVGHNTPTALWRVKNAENEILAIWNNAILKRVALSAALSSDGGRTWSKPRLVDDCDDALGASYPSITQTDDGTFVAVWQAFPELGTREIRFARFNREWVLGEKTL
ncbi:MAG TPA: sialidase family protein [Opitutaceae bacterium]|nr:sialidase family protein [Opitutaceae bacterium]